MIDRRTVIIAVASVLAAVSTGCQNTSEAFPYTKPVIWQAAVGRSLVWRPTVDEESYVITSDKIDLGDREVQRKLWLETDYNPFARRPSTRVFVSIRQVKPKTIRFEKEEKAFLDQLRAELRAMTGGP